jgi:hypothetical protein
VSGGTHAARPRMPGRFRLRDSHPLRWPVPAAFGQRPIHARGDCRPLRRARPTPARQRRQPTDAARVWAPPRSLAATEGILSFPRGTEMFQFPRCPPGRSRVPSRALGGLPHSDIPGSQAASASPGRFAAWPRPSSAANAKASTMRPSSRPLHGRRRGAPNLRARGPDRRAPQGPEGPPVRRYPVPGPRRGAWPDRRPPFGNPVWQGRSGKLLVWCARTGKRVRFSLVRGRGVWATPRVGLSMCWLWCGRARRGGAAGDRTPDLRRAKAALSRLSYGPPVEATPGWARLDSNQGPRPYQGRALTA